MYQVIIVEDDPMVSEIEKQYVEHNNDKLSIAGVFHNGQDALDFIDRKSTRLNSSHI